MEQKIKKIRKTRKNCVHHRFLNKQHLCKCDYRPEVYYCFNKCNFFETLEDALVRASNGM